MFLVLACAAAKDEDGNDSHWRVLLCVHVRVSEMELQTQAVPGLSGKGQYLDLAGKAYKPSFIDWLLLCVCLMLFLCPWARHCNRSSVHIFARVCVCVPYMVCVCTLQITLRSMYLNVSRLEEADSTHCQNKWISIDLNNQLLFSFVCICSSACTF